MGERFYVNAQSSDISYLFEYSPDSASENAVFHFSANSQGPCLTYTKSDDSLLDSTGTDTRYNLATTDMDGYGSLH